jgi:hypothetical protein
VSIQPTALSRIATALHIRGQLAIRRPSTRREKDVTPSRTTVLVAPGLTIFMLFLRASASFAQGTEPFSALQQTLRHGDRIEVDDTAGRRWQGTVLGVGPSALRLRVDGRDQDFNASDVRVVRRNGDRLRNGFLIGLGAGAGVGVAAGVTVVSSAETGSYLDSSLGYGALFAGIGAGVGMGVDALFKNRTVIYQAPGRVSASVAPITGRGRRGLGVTISF